MSKAKAKARAKARAMAKLANRPPKGAKPESSDESEVAEAKEQRQNRYDAKASQGNKFGPASHIKSAARTGRGAARSR